MLKTKNKILPLALNPYAKLKQRVLSISGLLLFLSLFLIDIINARTGSHLNGMVVFLKNAPLILPWGIAYLVTSKYKDLLRLYTPLYLSLILLVATSFSAFHCLTQAQDLGKKFYKELANILSNSSGALNESQTYSANEYGCFAAYLNKVKEMEQLYDQEHRATAEAVNKVEFDKFFTDEALFNFFNIITTKKKLEQLLLSLDASAKKIEDIYSEYVTWVASSPEIDEGFRQTVVEAISTADEKNKFLRQEPYRIKKDIVKQYVQFFDFLSKVYGTYEIDVDGQMLFANCNDLLIFRSHIEKLENLFKEEEEFTQSLEEKMEHMLHSSLQK